MPLDRKGERPEIESDVVRIGPSILAADFARLGEQLTDVKQSGADRIHTDITDGHFSSNISMRAPIVMALGNTRRSRTVVDDGRGNVSRRVDSTY